ncbi:MAG: helix-turn-helix domain-containing protein [Egibacteraceae bacterium]
MEHLTSGVGVVDDLIEGVRVGDNLVVQTAGQVPSDYFVRRFVAAVGSRRLVIVDVTGQEADWKPPAGEVLDWSVLSLDDARTSLDRADRRAGEAAAFVFDSLTAVQDRWGPQAALDLFLWACPRLYGRQSVALWLLDRDRHDAAFLSRLTEITQVVINVRYDSGGLELAVAKADGRARTVVGRKVRARFSNGELVSGGPVVEERERLGALVRALRTTRGLGQAELARRVGISPSALSQVERGVRGLSAENLMRVWEALGIPFGPDDPLSRGYRIARRGGQHTTSLAAGVTGERLVHDTVAGSVWRVTVDPRASGRQPLFTVKGTEIVWVLRGVLDVEVAGHAETLQEGDALVITGAMLSAWGNPAESFAQLVWFVAR